MRESSVDYLVEKGDGEEDKTIKPFAGLHKADKHIITVTAIYFE